MTKDNAEEIAKQIDAIKAAVTPHLRDRDHQAAAMALASLAAEHVFHDTGQEDDFMAVCRAAWKHCKRVHDEGQCTQ